MKMEESKSGQERYFRLWC